MKASRMVVWALLGLVLGPVLGWAVGSATVLSLMTQAVIFAVFALGVGLLLRQNGMVSFGHALYFGGAGYGVGIVLELGLLPAELGVVAVLLGTAVLAFVIGLVIVRVPGIAFGMLTLAIGQMFYLTATRARGLTGGADGMGVPWPSRVFGLEQSWLLEPSHLFVACWSVLVVLMLLLGLLLRGRFGAITEAVRDNEERARFIGIRTVAPRAAVYALSALVSALGGVLSVLNTGFVSPEALHWSLSGMALMMVIVGGFKVLWGPPLGAVVYFLFKDILGEYATHWMSIFGLLLIGVIVFSPEGVAGALQRLLGRRGREAEAVEAK